MSINEKIIDAYLPIRYNRPDGFDITHTTLREPWSDDSCQTWNKSVNFLPIERVRFKRNWQLCARHVETQLNDYLEHFQRKDT